MLLKNSKKIIIFLEKYSNIEKTKENKIFDEKR